jgi:serine/threonine protein kinase
MAIMAAKFPVNCERSARSAASEYVDPLWHPPAVINAFALEQVTGGYPLELPAFQTVRRLHAGPLEELFLVRWRNSGQYHALRALRPKHEGEAWALDRFALNAERYRSLDHPCLPRFSAPCRDGTDLLSEPLEGMDLSAYLREHGPLPASLWNPIQWQLFHALVYLQSRGIYRCEVDASRIFLCSNATEPTPLLIDYGFRWPGERETREPLNDLVEEAFFQEGDL